MAKLKKVGERFYFLAENKAEKAKLKLKWDEKNKAYYTDNPFEANKASEFACDEDTQKYFALVSENIRGSYGVAPVKDMRIPTRIFDYQARGVQEIILRLHLYKCALLADEQGLGKTIQIAKLMEDVIKAKPEERILVICPASLKLNWKKELLTWCDLYTAEPSPSDKVHRTLHEENIQVIKTSKDWISLGSQVVIVNYDLLTKEHIMSQLMKLGFYMCITDEAQYLKNMKASRTRAAAKVMRNIHYNIALTGTPILNRPVELYSLLHCIKALPIMKPYDTYRPFGFRFCNGFEGMWGFDVSGASNLEELNFRLRSTIMIRREKKDVLPQLPVKTFQVIALETNTKSKKASAALAKLVDLKTIQEKPELGSVGEIAKLRHELAMSKVDESIEHIKTVLEEKEKVVVFAHHKAMIEKLEEELKEYSPVVFDGSTSMTNKNKHVEAFQKDPACRVFLGQIQSAGVGITLTAADTVIFVESSWVPGEIEQAVDRCHRIGQTNNVLAQFITVAGSIDEVMLNSVIKKKDMINIIMK